MCPALLRLSLCLSPLRHPATGEPIELVPDERPMPRLAEIIRSVTARYDAAKRRANGRQCPCGSSNPKRGSVRSAPSAPPLVGSLPAVTLPPMAPPPALADLTPQQWARLLRAVFGPRRWI